MSLFFSKSYMATQKTIPPFGFTQDRLRQAQGERSGMTVHGAVRAEPRRSMDGQGRTILE